MLRITHDTPIPNTFHIPAKAATFVTYGREDIEELTTFLQGEGQGRRILNIGQGSNLLFLKDFDGIVLASEVRDFSVSGNRLRIVNGDVTQDFNVDGQVDTVFNCAAVVKHFSEGTEIEDVNVGGAQHCVDFCLRHNAKLIHVSTYSTAGLSINGTPAEDTRYTEQMLYFGQYLTNQYIHSKFLSERIVLDAIAQHGLNGKVMRVGNLAPRSTDGEFQINFQTNSAMGRIRVFRMLGCYPYEMSDEPMEFSPINETARSIVLLSETPRACCLFHPFNNHHVFFGDVMSQLSLIGDVPAQVEASAFQTAMAEAQEDPEKAKLMSSLLAYQDMSHGQESFVVPTLNSYTTQTLYRLGFRWSPTSWDYVGQFLQAIDGLGYFEA